jgi:hypothetical protein
MEAKSRSTVPSIGAAAISLCIDVIPAFIACMKGVLCEAVRSAGIANAIRNVIAGMVFMECSEYSRFTVFRNKVSHFQKVA